MFFSVISRWFLIRLLKFPVFLLFIQALSPRLETGLEQKIVLPRDSYLQVQCVPFLNSRLVVLLVFISCSFLPITIGLFLAGLFRQSLKVPQSGAAFVFCSQGLQLQVLDLTHTNSTLSGTKFIIYRFSALKWIILAAWDQGIQISYALLVNAIRIPF